MIASFRLSRGSERGRERDRKKEWTKDRKRIRNEEIV